ncbi:hypothetical protein [Stenomitos frigidus]|uniref:Uncharacterized protein n=1 Tax=Stenomitos frigidus ULC18 TaxID=2107698 RepID=A0A2T1E0C8_9CYAN|nr:hypothetical protein [Stenomitos frigidus]PSB26215.1 hypothetical protein C7B82_20570 [Stenomitos frigidus ULC18]
MATLSSTQWTTFELPITVRQPSELSGVPGTPVDLTGSTAEGCLFKGFTATERYLLTFEFASDRTTGTVTASLEPEQTGAIPYGDYLCQIKITGSLGRVQLLLNETITIAPGRPPHA